MFLVFDDRPSDSPFIERICLARSPRRDVDPPWCLQPWFMFPVALGVLAWLGLYLRDARLRSLLPLAGRACPPPPGSGEVSP